MRLLILDHYFDQDIAALRMEGGAEVELRSIHYGLLHGEAMWIFPDEIVTSLEALVRPDLEPQRREWARRLAGLLEEQFSIQEFDAFVSPSDLFFYVRDAPAACHRLGVPFLVVQKETTIAPYLMGRHASELREYSPPIADHMTVCSELQRDFQIRAGAQPDSVTVTGQPRFDYYSSLGSERIEAGYGEDGPVVLFFSYMLDAYHPDHGAGRPVWSDLHRQTEEGLWTLLDRGWRVLIKPHPQQPWETERRRIARAVGGALEDRVFLIDPEEDVRRLIASADVVVGFQTTALLESMVGGRPVVYTGWDPESRRLQPGLVPFHEWRDVLVAVERAEDLPGAVERAAESRHGVGADARKLAADYLGPVDGGASRRTLDVLRQSVERFASKRSSEVERHRATVATRRPPHPLRRRARMGLRTARVRVGRALHR